MASTASLSRLMARHVLDMADRENLAGRDLLIGIVAGYEVMARAGMFTAYHSSPEAARLFTEDLDTRPSAILQVEHKPFAGCDHILTPIAATLALKRRCRP